MSPNLNRKIILVADDDIEDQELFNDTISKIDSNVQPYPVFNGRDALEYLKNCTDEAIPCAILLDYNMPILNGYEVLEIICKEPRFASVPKFIWSTSNSNFDINACLDNGAKNYFVKPDSQHKLLALAKEILDACS